MGGDAGVEEVYAGVRVQRYASADFLSDNRVIFNIKGNKHRLVVQVQYQYGMVNVQWVGTHAEYSKKKF